MTKADVGSQGSELGNPLVKLRGLVENLVSCQKSLRAKVL